MERDDSSYRWVILGIVMAGTFMAIMDISTVNVALPRIMTSMRTDVKTVTWIITASMLSAAVTMPSTAWLGSRFGFERMYIFSLLVFTLGSGLCSIAWSLPSLIFFRVIQATGGGAMQPIGMALMVQYFPLEERGRALGMWGTVAMLAPTLGPTTGGYLTDWFGWRSLFWLHLVVGSVIIPLSIQAMGGKKAGPKPPPFDWQGYIALAIFLIAVLLGFDQGQEQGWYSSPILLAWAVGIIAFTTFFVSELTVLHPIFPFGLLRHRDFTLGLFVSLTLSVGLFGAIFLVPLFMQNIQWHNTIQTGLVLMPGAIMMAIFMPLSGYLTDRIGARPLVAVGITITALSFYLYHQIDMYSSVWDIISLQLIRGVGVGLMMTPTTTAAMNAVDRLQAGTASALLSVGQRVGGSFGIAFLATMLQRRTIVHLESLSDRITVMGGTGTDAVNQLKYAALSIGYGGTDALNVAYGTVMTFVSKSAQTRAFGDVFVMAAFLTFLGFPAALFLSRRIPHREALMSKDSPSPPLNTKPD